MTSVHILITAGLTLVGSVHAQSSGDHPAHHAATATATATTAAAATGPTSDAEVRRVDKEQGKVTLRHGPIANLDMPAMTMVFKVADRKLLDAIKSGDKVKFSAEDVNGALTVTAIEVVK
jgi:Cu/Ag efflux protein CusF